MRGPSTSCYPKRSFAVSKLSLMYLKGSHPCNNCKTTLDVEKDRSALDNEAKTPNPKPDPNPESEALNPKLNRPETEPHIQFF